MTDLEKEEKTDPAYKTFFNKPEKPKVLNVDEIFKKEICSRLGIQSSWLDEVDIKTRFRQNIIMDILSTERMSLKALAILKDYLLAKKRDKLETLQDEKDLKGLEKQVQSRIGTKILPLKMQMCHRGNNLLQQDSFRTFSPRTNRKAMRTDHIAITPHVKCNLNRNDYKRVISVAAEDLQRSIFSLENTVSSQKKDNLRSTMSIAKLTKSQREDMEKEIDKHQNLTKSILNRATSITQLKAQESSIVPKKQRRAGSQEPKS